MIPVPNSIPRFEYLAPRLVQVLKLLPEEFDSEKYDEVNDAVKIKADVYKLIEKGLIKLIRTEDMGFENIEHYVYGDENAPCEEDIQDYYKRFGFDPVPCHWEKTNQRTKEGWVWVGKSPIPAAKRRVYRVNWSAVYELLKNGRTIMENMINNYNEALESISEFLT